VIRCFNWHDARERSHPSGAPEADQTSTHQGRLPPRGHIATEDGPAKPLVTSRQAAGQAARVLAVSSGRAVPPRCATWTRVGTGVRFEDGECAEVEYELRRAEGHTAGEFTPHLGIRFPHSR
jgi:hypothetical protein